ncbi:membrane protein [Pseudomonas veronii 1YdBTEX2]|uniref:Membrane protein n=1 Tax=Pseudomonas veronii 1YdBTEX2 TaxID=1295141 RepID=A0A1D3K8J6_PSEVE|nr:membrane protein [Pseudomonas veronii 1YdBTEX2]
MQIAQIREFLLQHQYDSKPVCIARSIRTVFRVAVIYPAILSACIVALIGMQGRGFAEVPYRMLSTVETAQRLAGAHQVIPGQVLIERCADKPIEPSSLPHHQIVCGSHTVESISIDQLASQQGALIRATYFIIVGTFGFLELYRSFKKFRRRANA